MRGASVVRLFAGLTAMLIFAGGAHASSSPFGIATPDSTGSYFGGPLAPLFAWVAIHQAHFYRALTAAIDSIKADGSGLWLLFGLSFAYGVFHAVGPGHGKAVISSYLVATGESARRGIVLSFMAAMVQAVSAVIIVAIGAIVLRVSATAMTFATDWVEIVSYGAIALFGAWLLWAKIRGDHHHHHHHVEVGAAPAHAHERSDPHHDHDREHAHDQHDHDHGHDHDHDHDHGPRPVARPPIVARAWSAILAVGIRPCSGAIIVLVFALSQGLFAAGVAATFVMALGTGVTVAALATLAVTARGAALRLTGSGNSVGAYLSRAIEIGGAAMILLLGLVLLGGALSTGLPGAS